MSALCNKSTALCHICSLIKLIINSIPQVMGAVTGEADLFPAVRSRCNCEVCCKEVLCLVPLSQGRTDGQCQHRWQKVLNPELVKGPWTKEEDQKVRGAGSFLFWLERGITK